MRGTTTQRRKRGDQHTGRRGRGARCHSAAPRRSRKPHPPRIDIDLSEGETLPLVVVGTSAGFLIEKTRSRELPCHRWKRLQKRYLIMVQSHLRSAPELAAGVASLPSTSAAFAATQATWRFLNNERVGMPELIEPPREVGRGRVRELKSRFALLVHDWCKLSFTYGKRDLTQLTHATDIGYELTTALFVSADDGSPLAPMEMHLKTAGGVITRGIQRLTIGPIWIRSCRRWRQAAGGSWTSRCCTSSTAKRTRWTISVSGMPQGSSSSCGPMIAACSGPVSLFS